MRVALKRTKQFGLRCFTATVALIGIFSQYVVLPSYAVSDTAEASQNIINTAETMPYFDIFNALSKQKKLETPVELSGTAYSSRENLSVELTEVGGKSGILLNSENSWCEWDFDVSESGTAAIEISYVPVTDCNNDIILNIEIDGKNQFAESEQCSLSRIWMPVLNEGNQPFEKDSKGNEILPDQVQVSDWMSEMLQDAKGLYGEPFLFYLEEGKHKVKLTVKESSVVIGSLSFCNKEYISYSEYYEKYSPEICRGNDITYLQAEIPYSTSSTSINSTYDKMNAATVPSNPKNIVMNIIGGSHWSDQGDSVSWKVKVPKAGMYRVAFRARQNLNPGLISYRDLYINGKIPFKEAMNIRFEYSQSWKVFLFGEENVFWLYLKPNDILTLRCTTGDTAPILRDIQAAVSSLNEYYLA